MVKNPIRHKIKYHFGKAVEAQQDVFLHLQAAFELSEGRMTTLTANIEAMFELTKANIDLLDRVIKESLQD